MSLHAKLRSSVSATLLLVAWAGTVCGKDPELVATLKHDGAVTSLAFTPDTQQLFCCVYDAETVIWNVPKRRQVGTIKLERGSIDKLKLTSNGKHALFFFDYRRKLRFWDLKGKKAVRELTPPFETIGNAFAVSSDGQLIAIATDRNKKLSDISLIDSSTGKPKAKLSGHTENLQEIVFSADGRHVVSAAYEGVRIWDLKTNQIRHAIPVKQRANGVDVSPDGKSIAIAGYGEVITVDIESGKVLHNVKRHDYILGGVAFAPDGKTIASCDLGGVIKLWNAADLTEEHTLISTKGKAIFDVEFSPDGSLLAVGGRDNTVKLWQVGEPVQVASVEQPAETDEPAETGKPVRTWTAGGGKYKVKARLVKFDGVNVHLKLESGKTIKVPLKKLDEADQKYLRDRAK